MGKVIGIDLGTTNSCVAVMEGGEPVVIPNSEGSRTTPSMVGFTDSGERLVGQIAKRQAITNPENTVFAVKRLIGRKFDSPEAKKAISVSPFRVVPSPNGDAWVESRGKGYSPPEISAIVLMKMKQTAEDYLGEPVTEAVVTVPAYFNDSQRQATKDAGRIAGLNVLRIINEPTAAALAYGLDKVGQAGSERIAVYDLGGGTFDVSIIEIRERIFEVKATGGDVFLGGIDFDNAIIHHVLKDFASKVGIDLATDPVAMQRIKDLAERTKIDLSARDDVQFNIPFITMTAQGQPLNIEMKFSRKMLEQLTNHLVDRTLQMVARVLVDSGLSTKDIDEVLLVGGQTRMPVVQDRLTKFFGKSPSKGVHPDEAVAVGAALYAKSLEDNSSLRLQLLDVIPMAIGLERAGGAFHTVFQRNAPIPNAKQLVATTSQDNQTELAMRIYQGDHEQVAKNDLLGEFTFSGIRPAKAGSVQVEITFDVNVEGILTMRARDPATGREMNTTVRVSSQ